MAFARDLGVSAERVMLIPFIQGIIGSLNENFSPLNERGCKKPGNRTENHFLKKSRLHFLQ
jgi:hypothetical protein